MKKILFSIVLIFSLISLIIHNNYSITQNVAIHSNVADPIFNISFAKSVILDNHNNSIQYSFTVSNFKANIISDIPFIYYFYIENLTTDFSIKCYINSKEISLTNYKSESFLLQNKFKEEHIFNIYISYISNYNNSILSTIKLKFFYEQYSVK